NWRHKGQRRSFTQLFEPGCCRTPPPSSRRQRHALARAHARIRRERVNAGTRGIREEYVKMPRKMARPDLDHRPVLPEVLVAVRTSLPSCRKAGKTPTFMPVRKSSGESRIMMRL